MAMLKSCWPALVVVLLMIQCACKYMLFNPLYSNGLSHSYDTTSMGLATMQLWGLKCNILNYDVFLALNGC